MHEWGRKSKASIVQTWSKTGLRYYAVQADWKHKEETYGVWTLQRYRCSPRLFDWKWPSIQIDAFRLNMSTRHWTPVIPWKWALQIPSIKLVSGQLDTLTTHVNGKSKFVEAGSSNAKWFWARLEKHKSWLVHAYAIFGQCQLKRIAEQGQTGYCRYAYVLWLQHAVKSYQTKQRHWCVRICHLGNASLPACAV